MVHIGKNQSLDTERFNDGVDDVKKKNKAIMHALIEADMTQTQLAEKAEMHLTHINSIVNGTLPRVDTAIKIARALGTTVEALWGTEEE